MNPLWKILGLYIELQFKNLYKIIVNNNFNKSISYLRKENVS